MDMVERVGAAIKLQADYWLPGETHQAYQRRVACAAIGAMRDLDETIFALAMHEIDDLRGPSREGKQVFREFFRAAFDAALSSNREGGE